MLEKLTHEDFEPQIGSAFTIHTNDHDEVLTLTTVDLGKQYAQAGRQSFALVFNGSSADLYFHSQVVRLEHPEMGTLEIMISPVGRNDEDGIYRYEAVFN